MKMLLEDDVYDVPTTMLIAWINITPALRERMAEHWRGFRREHFPERKTMTARERDHLLERFNAVGRDDTYCAIMLDALLDLRETMGDDFEEFRIDMRPEEVESLAEDYPSYTPREPIKIPINGDT